MVRRIKYQIKDRCVAEEEEVEEVIVELGLIHDGAGGVDLVTLDEDGDPILHILVLNADGTLTRHEDGNLGILGGDNPDNMIQISGEEEE